MNGYWIQNCENTDREKMKLKLIKEQYQVDIVSESQEKENTNNKCCNNVL